MFSNVAKSFLLHERAVPWPRAKSCRASGTDTLVGDARARGGVCGGMCVHDEFQCALLDMLLPFPRCDSTHEPDEGLFRGDGTRHTHI